MEDEVLAKRRRLEHHRGLRDALGLSYFHMEDLPEEIQPLVLSLLSLKEAARTSIVSRNWRKLWTHYPNLCFDGSKNGSTVEDSVKIERAKFIETVNSIIQQHSGTWLNKFNIRCNLRKNHSDHLDRWVCFATASKAKIIDMNLWPERISGGPRKNVYHFPLEALDAQDGPFIQSLFLTNVSIEPHSDICGFTKLRKLLLHCVQIIGDLPVLVLNCSSLEDLEVVSCSGVTDLNIPHQLDKLRHLRISNSNVQMVEFHVPLLSHFEYQGDVIPIVLHGCPTLEEATLKLHKALYDRDNNKALFHAITGIPSISVARVLNLHTFLQEDRPVWSSQVPRLPRPACMFVNLRHLTCGLHVRTEGPNNHAGILLLAHYLDCAPQLETLQLHMYYVSLFDDGCTWRGNEASFRMRRLDHLKTAYMSGFRCYRPQVELLCGVLQNCDALEHVTLEPKVTLYGIDDGVDLMVEHEICGWANRASERYGKAITVLKTARKRLGLLGLNI